MPACTQVRSILGLRLRVAVLSAALIGVTCCATFGPRTATAAGTATPDSSHARVAAPMTERTIEFETSEVTDASIDVAPDGQWLVFTLLGDLYRLPIAGGMAEVLTEGWPADQCPRVSPDGGSIAFVSDREGEGIYLYDLAKKSTRRVTSKIARPSRLLWSADGSHLFAQSIESPRGRSTRRLMQVDVKTGASSPANAAGSIASSDLLDEEMVAARRASPGGAWIASITLRRGLPDEVTITGRTAGDRRVLDAGTIRYHELAEQVSDLAWLPDESAIVIAGGGGLRVVPIDGSPARSIPFQAKVRFSRLDGARAACVAPAPKRTWNPRGIPDLVIAPPSGKTVVYNSAGDLFIAPFRTAKGQTMVAGPNWDFRPLWAQDGRGIVYQRFDGREVTTWLKDLPKSDDKTAVLNLRTPEHEVVEPAGRYTLEAWHPDGERMLISQIEQGARKLSILDPSTGELVALWTTTSLVEPSAFFGPTDQDLYFTDLAENGAPNLFKVSLTTLDRAVRVTEFERGAWGTRLSPDQTQVLFRRNFELWAAPSKTTAGGPRDRDAERVSESADGPFGWFFNSKNAYNIDAATFQGIRVADREEVSFNVENIFGLPPKGASAVLDHVGVVDVVNGTLLEDRTIVIADGRITRIADPVDAQGAQGARLDCRGLYAIPGLIDLKASWGEALPRQILASGVTTVLDRGSEVPLIASIKDGTDAGLLAGPRYFGSGPRLDRDPTGMSYLSIETAAEADDAVRHVSERGCEWIELGGGLSREVRRAGMSAANARTLPAGFSARDLAGLVSAISDGAAAVHGSPGATMSDDVIQLLVRSGVTWSPGLGSLAGLSKPQSIEAREAMALGASSALFAGVSAATGEALTVKKAAATAIARAVKAGTHVVCASDSPGTNRLYGVTLLAEIEDLVAGGLSPAEALRAATLEPAKTLGLDTVLGSAESGKLADLVLLKANPLENIAAIESTVYVVREGRVYKRDDLLLSRAAGGASKPR